MAQITRALDYINQLARGAAFSSIKFKDIFEYLQICALRKGFSDEVLKELVTLWLQIKIPVGHWNALGCCMVPERRVSDETVLVVVHWILNNHFLDDNTFKVFAALNWLNGLHELNLLNVDVLEPYYDFFFFFIYNDKLSVPASKLVYSYTRSRDVTRGKALNILNLIEKKKSPRQSKCLLVLLALFKSYRPECVPEEVPVVSIDEAFSKPQTLLMERLRDAQIRSNVQQNQTSENRLVWWTGEFGTKKFRRQNVIHILPYVDYLESGSVIYMKDGPKCLDFTSPHNLMVHHCGNRITVPANILSLMVNDAGLHILQFSDPQSQARLSQTLYHTLDNNFLRFPQKNLSVVEKTLFLKRISVLEARLLQGIPVVSRFLAQYMSSWNGIDHLKEILELLQWITFDNYDELYDLILVPIEGLFLTNDVKYRCALLVMLKKMCINIHTMVASKRKYLFLNLPLDDVEILKNFGYFISELCEKTLNTIPDSDALKHYFLDIYEVMADLELQCEKPVWSIMPETMVYGILFSYNAFAIDRIVGLLLKYRDIYDKIIQNHPGESFKYQKSTLGKYIMDYVNCLWLGCAITKRDEGLMLRDLPKKWLEGIGDRLVRYDQLLDIKHHVAFAPFMKEDQSTDIEDLLKTMILPNFKNIARLIELIKLKL